MQDGEQDQGRSRFVNSVRAGLRKKAQVVLIVDDESSVRRVVRRGIEHMAPQVIIEEAGDGKQALEAIASIRKKHKCDPVCIVLDLNLPVMDGWQVLEQLRKQIEDGHSPIPVIVLSATSGEKGLFFRKSVHNDSMGYQPLVTVAKQACSDMGKYDATGEEGVMAWMEHFIKTA